MDLFDYMREQNKETSGPLASRMRPTTLDEVVGQQHIVGKDKLLYRAIKADKLSSIIFYGPPGTGKTTLAKVIAHTTSAEFMQIGATTENPYFEVNGALLSRSVIFELKKLSTDDIKVLLKRALTDTEKGMGAYNAQIDDDALDFLADVSNGDARAALTAIELGVLTTDRSDDGIIHITIDVASECIQKRVISYDKKGDNHYDTISAFIKSMRGSDPDAAVYYLARMLYAGEDVKFIARRIMILASEDIGNADPMAMVVAASAAAEVERVGMPEAQIILSQAVTYMACAPKSNASYNAISAAMSCVKQTKTPAVPAHLQDAHYGAAEKLGHGVGYKYAHDYPNHYVKQQYLPDGLTDRVFYKPTDIGYEAKIKAHMDELHRDCDT